MNMNSALSLGNAASDFLVHEIPLYTCAGEGHHRYLLIEKHGIHTDTVVQHLSSLVHCSQRDIGFAGRKDKHAHCQQYISIPAIYDAQLTADNYDIANGSFRILKRELHNNKLQLGHLRGNRFSLRLNAQPADTDQQALNGLQRNGMVNYFGSQRFGHNKSNLAAAAAWHSHKFQECVDILCADSSHGSGMTRTLHRHFRSGMNAKDALDRSGKSLRQFLASSLQSDIFNAITRTRIDAGLGRTARVGDLLMRNGPSAFHARDDELDTLNAELNNAEEHLCCSAPLPGHKVRSAKEGIAEQEQQWSENCCVSWDAFAKKEIFASSGQRRRIYACFLEKAHFEIVDDDNSKGCILHCALPSGSYVTVALDQLGIAWDRSNPAAQG